jgi:hypothetical protein
VASAYLWDYHQAIPTADIMGFDIEASDGSIGKSDSASREVGAGYIVVDTSSWKNLGMGQQSVLPAGVIEQVDPDEEIVRVGVSKDEIKTAPVFAGTADAAYRADLDAYYHPLFPKARSASRRS